MYNGVFESICVSDQQLLSTWNQVPIQFFGANLNCLGKMYFENEVPLIKSNNAFIEFNGIASVDVLFASRREAGISFTQNTIKI